MPVADAVAEVQTSVDEVQGVYAEMRDESAAEQASVSPFGAGMGLNGLVRVIPPGPFHCPSARPYWRAIARRNRSSAVMR